MLDNWYTPEQLGARLQIEVRTLQAQARKGAIPGAKKIGNQWRFDVSKIERWLTETTPAPTAGSPNFLEERLSPASQAKLDRLRAFRRK